MVALGFESTSGSDEVGQGGGKRGAVLDFELGEASDSVGKSKTWLRSSIDRLTGGGAGIALCMCAYRKGSRTPEPFYGAIQGATALEPINLLGTDWQPIGGLAIPSDVDPKRYPEFRTPFGKAVSVLCFSGTCVSVSCHPAFSIRHTTTHLADLRAISDSITLSEPNQLNLDLFSEDRLAGTCFAKLASDPVFAP